MAEERVPFSAGLSTGSDFLAAFDQWRTLPEGNPTDRMHVALDDLGVAFDNSDYTEGMTHRGLAFEFIVGLAFNYHYKTWDELAGTLRSWLTFKDSLVLWRDHYVEPDEPDDPPSGTMLRWTGTGRGWHWWSGKEVWDAPVYTSEEWYNTYAQNGKVMTVRPYDLRGWWHYNTGFNGDTTKVETLVSPLTAVGPHPFRSSRRIHTGKVWGKEASPFSGHAVFNSQGRQVGMVGAGREWEGYPPVSDKDRERVEEERLLQPYSWQTPMRFVVTFTDPAGWDVAEGFGTVLDGYHRGEAGVERRVYSPEETLAQMNEYVFGNWAEGKFGRPYVGEVD